MATKVDLLLAGGTVISVDERRRIIRDGAVAIRGTDIVAVGKREQLERDFEARTVRDC
jgi:5-methylthioadenosine/S-adenosylhomocysteine deaminase